MCFQRCLTISSTRLKPILSSFWWVTDEPRAKENKMHQATMLSWPSSTLLSYDDNLCVHEDSVQSSVEYKATSRLSQHLLSFPLMLLAVNVASVLPTIPLTSLEVACSLFINLVSCVPTNKKVIWWNCPHLLHPSPSLGRSEHVTHFPQGL